jgi:hypothetical protein
VTTAHPRRIVAVAVLAQTLAPMDNTILNAAPETPGDGLVVYGVVRGGTAMLLLFFGLAGQLFYTAFVAGAVMASAAVGIVLGNQISPTLCRLLSARWCAGAGMVLSSLTFGSYIWFSADPPIAWLVVSPRTGQTMAAAISASRPIGSTLGVAVLGTLLTTGYRTAILPALTDLPPVGRNPAAQSAEATRTLARTLHRPNLLAAANRAYLHATDPSLPSGQPRRRCSGPLLVIRCLRSQEPALETTRGHRPASLTDTASRG